MYWNTSPHHSRTVSMCHPIAMRLDPASLFHAGFGNGRASVLRVPASTSRLSSTLIKGCEARSSAHKNAPLSRLQRVGSFVRCSLRCCPGPEPLPTVDEQTHFTRGNDCLE